MAPLPSDRLLQAGATREELAQLEAEHEASSLPEQEGRIAHFEKLAIGDIAEWLDTLRKAGRFVVAEVEKITAAVEGKSSEKPPASKSDRPADD